MKSIAPKVNKLFLSCFCSSEVISFIHYPKEDHFEFYINIYKSMPGAANWKEKLRMIYYILKGTYFEDQIVLGRKEVNKLREFLKKI